MKVTDSWYSERLEQPIGLARWGHFGTPVLVFPTAGGDAEEIERNGLVDACLPLIESGRIKLYSCDSVAGQAMVAEAGSPEYRMWLSNQYHHAVLGTRSCPRSGPTWAAPRRRSSRRAPRSGRSTPLAVLCRFPDVFRAAVGMSGTYRIQRFFDGRSSPDLVLRLAGRTSSPAWTASSWTAAAAGSRSSPPARGRGRTSASRGTAGNALGRKGVPNRVDPWGEEWPHEWPTWRRMLPQYLDELCPSS